MPISIFPGVPGRTLATLPWLQGSPKPCFMGSSDLTIARRHRHLSFLGLSPQPTYPRRLTAHRHRYLRHLRLCTIGPQLVICPTQRSLIYPIQRPPHLRHWVCKHTRKHIQPTSGHSPIQTISHTSARLRPTIPPLLTPALPRQRPRPSRSHPTLGPKRQTVGANCRGTNPCRLSLVGTGSRTTRLNSTQISLP